MYVWRYHEKKVIMAVFLVGILLIVGFSVYGLNKFFNSPEMLTKNIVKN